MSLRPELAGEYGAVTITFGEIAENHAGMQKIGTARQSQVKLIGESKEILDPVKVTNCNCASFTFEELRNLGDKLKQNGVCDCDFIILNSPTILATVENVEIRDKCLTSDAGVLVLRNGVNALLGRVDGANLLLAEHSVLPVDTKAMMRGKVVNKHARYNLCFSDFSQEPDYAQGRGRIIDFINVPLTSELRTKLPIFLGDKASELQGEGNYYYDVCKCGIGFHGDGERQIVIGTRLGAEFPLEYQWFYNSQAIGSRVRVNLHHGDIYIMSTKAVGQDWKRRSIPTLRHAAGATKYLTIT